jgi:hypothetical protein
MRLIAGDGVEMKKGIVVIVLSAMWLATAYAGTYESQFGFSIDLPSHWNIVNMKNLKDNPERYFSAHNGRSKNIDESFSEKNKKEILGGKVEIYENLSTNYDNFTDNIYVQMDHGDVKPLKAVEKAICNVKMLKAAFSKSFGRNVNVYACKVVKVSSYDAIYMDFDGAYPGTRSLQFQIWKPSNDIIIMTLTTKNKTLKKLRDEFTAIAYSLNVTK